MSGVIFERVVKEYGAVTALKSLDLKVEEGEFLTLLGPSGCGKTTTLRLIAGFIRPSSGNLYLGEEEITHLPPEKRNVGMVFQDYALFPHMTIEDNIGFGLVERGVDKALIRARVQELLALVSLPGVENRYPSQLSGGQQQRIAVARAVAYAPKVLLMDEPLGALDLKLRESMQFELRRIQQELGITAVYVTHDQSEAMNMSDRIAVMNHGVLDQIGTAEEIYDTPRTKFVADFVGQINFLPARIVEADGGWAMIDTPGGRTRVASDGKLSSEDELSFAIRPERMGISMPGEIPTGRESMEGHVTDVRFAGNRMLIHAVVGGDRPIVVEAGRADPPSEVGTRILLTWNPEDAILLAE